MLRDFSIGSLIESIGRNVISQQFTFINYIMSNYVTFPAFGLLNIYYLIVWACAKVFSHNSLGYNTTMRNQSFKFYKQFAYTAHMLVIGLVMCVSAPFTNVIIFVTYFLLCCIDRYTLLYETNVDITSDMAAHSNMLVSMISSIYFGLIFMLTCMFCYFSVDTSAMNYLGMVVCVICLFGAVIYKIVVDQRFKRSLTQLVLGNFDETYACLLNPAHIDSEFRDEDNYLSRYDLNDPTQLNQLVSLVGKKLRIQSPYTEEELSGPKNILVASQNNTQKDRSATADKVAHVKQQILAKYGKKLSDKLLGHIYCDLTQLPISAIRVDDVFNNDRVCFALA